MSANAIDHCMKDAVLRSCVLLDSERFDDYLALWASDGSYRITSWSPDLRKELVLLELDVESYRTLLNNVQHHEHMLGQFSRHITGQLVDHDATGGATVTSSLLVMRTDLEGVSSVFAVGKYIDHITLEGDTALITAREVRLETREFGPGSHIPM